MEAFTQEVVGIIKSIPEGRVCTYGTIALMSEKSTGARQVARIIHSMSRKHGLAWRRVINAQGRISLPRSRGYEEQKALLKSEGVLFDDKDRIDQKIFLWTGPSGSPCPG